MKKLVLLLCFCVLLTGCNSTGDTQPETSTTISPDTLSDSLNTSQTIQIDVRNVLKDWPFDENNDTSQNKCKPPKPQCKLSEEEISKLSTKKCGYGQGVRLDDKNKPFCATDFNNQFLKYDSYAINDTDEKVICITFDQGYENGYTAKILDTLKEKGVKANFFILHDYAVRNPELVKRMIDEGHTIGNHSVHHYSMPTLDINTCRKEITDAHKYILDKFGYDMTTFRPPMGEFSEQSLAVTQSTGYKTILWSYAYADWDPAKQMEPAKALDKLTKAVHPGAIYLLHSVSKTNCEILGQFIDSAKTQGYSFTTMQ